MDIKDVLLADVLAELTDRFEVGERFDVADGAADLDDDDLSLLLAGDTMDPLLDLIRYMRDDLHRRAQVITARFLCDDRVVDLARGHVRRARDVPVDEALVVAKVQIALGAVFGDEDLTMLIGRHRPGVDVEVGIHLERRDGEASRGEDATEGSGGDAFAQRGSDPSGHEHKLRHGLDLRGFFNDTGRGRATSDLFARSKTTSLERVSRRSREIDQVRRPGREGCSKR